MKKMSLLNLLTVIWVLGFSFWIYIQIDYYFINPVNKEKMPDSFPELRNKIKEDVNYLTRGLPKPTDEASYYKPTVNSVSEYRKFPYDDKYLSIILENIPKDKNLQIVQNEDDNTILSYCDYNVHTKISKEYTKEKGFIIIYVEFEDRGICMGI